MSMGKKGSGLGIKKRHVFLVSNWRKRKEDLKVKLEDVHNAMVQEKLYRDGLLLAESVFHHALGAMQLENLKLTSWRCV